VVPSEELADRTTKTGQALEGSGTHVAGGNVGLDQVVNELGPSLVRVNRLEDQRQFETSPAIGRDPAQ